MKKKLVILICLCVVSSISFAKVSAKSIKNVSKEFVKTQGSEKAESNKNVCRITCSVSTKDEDGNVVTYTATAGSIFTSCETAGEKACTKAREAMAAAFGIEFHL